MESMARVWRRISLPSNIYAVNLIVWGMLTVWAGSMVALAAFALIAWALAPVRAKGDVIGGWRAAFASSR